MVWPGIALAAGASAELAIDSPGLVALSADDLETGFGLREVEILARV